MNQLSLRTIGRVSTVFFIEEYCQWDNCITTIHDVIQYLETGPLQFNNIPGRPLLSDLLRLQVLQIGWRYFQNADSPFEPSKNISMVVYAEEILWSCQLEKSWILLLLPLSFLSTFEQESGFKKWKSMDRETMLENRRWRYFTQWNDMQRNLSEEEGFIDAKFQSQIKTEEQREPCCIEFYNTLSFLEVKILHCTGTIFTPIKRWDKIWKLYLIIKIAGKLWSRY